MDKMDQQILAVDSAQLSALLEKALESRGFLSLDFSSFDEILDGATTGRRGDLEVDSNFKQVIPYAIVKHQDQILYYIRSGAIGDERLSRKLSIGFGGHIEIEDIEHPDETIEAALKRELMEEIGISSISDINPVGYIYTEQTEVDKMHLGVLYVISIANPNLRLDREEISRAEFVEIEELAKLMTSDEYDPESWTKIALQYLKAA